MVDFSLGLQQSVYAFVTTSKIAATRVCVRDNV